MKTTLVVGSRMIAETDDVISELLKVLNSDGMSRVHGKRDFVIPTKSFVKIGITKIFCYNNEMFGSINKTFDCCGEIFGCSNKIFICCP